MPFLTQPDFSTHLYAEIIEEITRKNDEVFGQALKAAIAEAKMYLNRYDLLAIFGDANTEPTVAEVHTAHLKSLVKDITCWHLVRLANPNVNLELFRTIYEDAIKLLEKISTGRVDPQGWPYRADDPATDFNENNTVQWSSNKKQSQHF